MIPDTWMILLGLLGWVLLLGGLWMLVRINKQEPPKSNKREDE